MCGRPNWSTNFQNATAPIVLACSTYNDSIGVSDTDYYAVSFDIASGLDLSQRWTYRETGEGIDIPTAVLSLTWVSDVQQSAQQRSKVWITGSSVNTSTGRESAYTIQLDDLNSGTLNWWDKFERDSAPGPDRGRAISLGWSEVVEPNIYITGQSQSTSGTHSDGLVMRYDWDVTGGIRQLPVYDPPSFYDRAGLNDAGLAIGCRYISEESGIRGVFFTGFGTSSTSAKDYVTRRYDDQSP